MNFKTLAARDTKLRERPNTERNAKTQLKSTQMREKPGKSVHGVFRLWGRPARKRDIGRDPFAARRWCADRLRGRRRRVRRLIPTDW